MRARTGSGATKKKKRKQTGHQEIDTRFFIRFRVFLPHLPSPVIVNRPATQTVNTPRNTPRMPTRTHAAGLVAAPMWSRGCGQVSESQHSDGGGGDANPLWLPRTPHTPHTCGTPCPRRCTPRRSGTSGAGRRAASRWWCSAARRRRGGFGCSRGLHPAGKQAPGKQDKKTNNNKKIKRCTRHEDNHRLNIGKARTRQAQRVAGK